MFAIIKPPELNFVTTIKFIKFMIFTLSSMALDNKLVLIFGMNGNIFDNYHVKAECFGKALSENVIEQTGIEEKVEFYSGIYIETSGMNALRQIETAFKRVSNAPVTQSFLEKTEKDYRDYLEIAELKTKMHADVEQFLTNNKSKYNFTITTTVPLERIDLRAKRTGIDQYFEIICARGGVWEPGKQTIIPGFDKGKDHYDYLMKRFDTSIDNLITVSATKADIINSRANKIQSIGVVRIFDYKGLLEISPDYIIEDYTKLPRLLERISALNSEI